MGINYNFEEIEASRMPLLRRWIETSRHEDYSAFERSGGKPLPSVSFDKVFGFLYDYVCEQPGDELAGARLAIAGPRARPRDDGLCHLEPAEVREAAAGLRRDRVVALEKAVHRIVFATDVARDDQAGEVRWQKLKEESYAICLADLRQLHDFYEAAASRANGVFIHVA
jgi:hypothetical protein